jgi:hypothetical protein
MGRSRGARLGYHARPVKRLLPAVALAAALACAHRPPPAAGPAAEAPPAASPAPPAAAAPEAPIAGADPGPAADDPLRDLRVEVDELLRAQSLALWAAWTRGEAIDLARTYSGKARLFAPETVRVVRAAWLRAEGDERRALGLLHGFLAGEHLARETAGSAERLARARAAAAVRWNGQSVAPERVAALLATEPERARREALQRAAAASAAAWTSAAEAHVAELETAARRLGHPSLLALAAEIRGEPAEALAGLADAVLDATAPAYEAAMAGLAQPELGAADAVRGHDVPRLFRAAQDPRLFPGDRLLADVRALFGGLGLDLASRPGATFDTEARPRKDPRALALPIDVPGDVRLSVVPGGGVAEARALLHEMAAAVFYAHVESPRVEYRRLGDVVARAWSQLFEQVAGDPAWLLARTGDSEHHLAPLVRAAAALRLHAAREAAARVLLELRRPRTAAEASALLERAFLRPATREEATLALAERDPLLHSADALRAALLAAQAESFLTARAKGPWWAEPRNGAWLRRAFAEGARPSPAALAAALGAPRLRAEPLAELARERLRWADEH